MPKLTRRDFVKTAAAGTAAAAVVALGPFGIANAVVPSATPSDVISFRAVGGLPQAGFPSYASLVVEGRVNLSTQSGVISKNVFAGPPSGSNTIAIPGLSRVVRVTDVRSTGNAWQILGTVDDQSQLLRDETRTNEFIIDLPSKTAQASFMGGRVQLSLE